MKSSEIRERYLEFFKKRGHVIIPSAPLVLDNDPTTLFTGSGMQPLVPYLLGEQHPAGKRLVNSQKCFRAEDIEEVGDNRHTTFFEMLGNWSLGDYFKEAQLPWFFEFLTDPANGAGLAPERLYVTVFAGDEVNGIPRDDEAAEIWKKLFKEKGIEAEAVMMGSPARTSVSVRTVHPGGRSGGEAEAGERGMKAGERIFYYDAKKNWWSRAGAPEKMPVGEPGGPDSEVFYDFDPSGKMHDERFGKYCHPNCDCGRFMEIGNSVFMQYRKNGEGGFDELPQKNVDFGGGLERITAASEGDPDVFKIDTFGAIISEIEQRSNKQYGNDESATQSFRVVADHLRGAVFMIADGVLPTNKEQGYFVRRLLRRAVRHMDLLSMRENTLHDLVGIVTEGYRDAYPALHEREAEIHDAVEEEEKKFRVTLARGMKEFERLIVGHRMSDGHPMSLSGVDVFDLYQTYGFPLEMTLELARERGITINREEFEEELKKHQDTSRAGMEKKFHGGLADHSEASVRYHTATHLLHQALRNVLGEQVFQKGSNITQERLRFDFSHIKKMTPEEIRKTEEIVNDKIEAALPVRYEILPIEEAKQRGAIGLFEETYGEKVKIYIIGEGENRMAGAFSLEFCGGPHVENTKELAKAGKFKIVKEEAVSLGVRRIKAVLT